MSGLIISERALQMLEWPQFLELFSSFISSPAARQQIAKVRPVDRHDEQLQLSQEALQCAARGQIPSMDSLEDVAPLLQKSLIENTVLDGIEVHHVGRLTMLNNELRGTTREWKREFPRLY